MNKVLVIGGVCCALPLIVIGFIFLSQNSDNPDTGEKTPILGRDHVPEGIPVTYNSNPPTSGNHWLNPAEWGAYSSPLPDEQLVHNLEHGGIWISYRGIDDATKEKLNAFAEKYPQAVIVTPRKDNDTAIAVASWGRSLKFETYDEQLIEAFIQSNVNNSPEPLASLGDEGTQQSIHIGASFPRFNVTEVDGRTITNESLKGKPAIIWFTTSWCIPCQIGARDVSELDSELGGNAFAIVVIFVDSREDDSDLLNWRERFANEDWMVAFDNPTDNVAAKVKVKFLDTKYLLDEDGVIKNIDVRQVNDQYMKLLKETINQS